MRSLYREHTPIEEVVVKGVTVFVKRDDLFGRPPAPPLGKLRGMRIVLRTLYENDVRLVGCWDTRVSRLGEGLAAACREFPRMRAVVSYPTRNGTPLPGPVSRAAHLGATILPLRGNHVAICFAQSKTKVEALGGVMLPFGLECQEAVTGVAKEAARVPPDLCRGTIVLCCGSGVTLAGLVTGLKQLPQRLIGISSGRSLAKIRSCIQRYVAKPPRCVELVKALMPYDSVSTVACPFPAHPNYDLKAWQYLQNNIRKLKPPILFWNIGA
jgi:hypothetical protein